MDGRRQTGETHQSRRLSRRGLPGSYIRSSMQQSNDRSRQAPPPLSAFQTHNNAIAAASASQMQNNTPAAASSAFRLNPRAPVWNSTNPSGSGPQSNTSAPANFQSQTDYPVAPSICTQYPPSSEDRQRIHYRTHARAGSIMSGGSQPITTFSVGGHTYQGNRDPTASQGGIQYNAALSSRSGYEPRWEYRPNANGSQNSSTRYTQNTMANRRAVMQPPSNAGNTMMTHLSHLIYPTPTQQAGSTQNPPNSYTSAQPVREYGNDLLDLPYPLPPLAVEQGEKKPICAVCMENFDEKDISHNCVRCNLKYCRNCIREWFLEACRNESKMPPKCCKAISISTVSSLFTAEQTQLYKAKLEEHLTDNRLYCPVPRCSAFVPRRLYMTSDERSKDTNSSVAASSPTQPAKKSNIQCPTCGTSICTKCHSHSHSDVETCKDGGDIDPLLEEKLQKWKIKRCPKCRAGVRKVYGCSHVECRCGGHFCFGCLKPIGQCDNDECEEAGSEHETDFEEDDLDGHAGYFEGDEHDFGPEPINYEDDYWNCRHLWRQLTNSPATTIGHANDDLHLECLYCYCSVRAADTLGESRASTDVALGWDCRCGMIACEACKTHLSTR